MLNEWLTLAEIFQVEVDDFRALRCYDAALARRFLSLLALLLPA